MPKSSGVPFPVLCQAAGLPEPVAEHQFAKELGRRWRFDWAFPRLLVAVEQEGGVWTGGRHTRGAGAVKDMEKYNTATYLGWKVYRFTPAQIKSGQAVSWLAMWLLGQVTTTSNSGLYISAGSPVTTRSTAQTRTRAVSSAKRRRPMRAGDWT